MKRQWICLEIHLKPGSPITSIPDEPLSTTSIPLTGDGTDRRWSLFPNKKHATEYAQKVNGIVLPVDVP